MEKTPSFLFTGIVPVLYSERLLETCSWFKQHFGLDYWTFPEKEPFVFAGIQLGVGTEIFYQYAPPNPKTSGDFVAAYIRLTGLHALFAHVKDHVDVVEVPKQQPYGDTEFVILDPNGYKLVFSEDMR